MSAFRQFLSAANGDTLGDAARKNFDEHARSICVRTDRMFAVLMVLQWIGGIVMALLVSPRTWIGAQSQLHPHVIMAVVGGAILAALPVTMAVTCPGRLATRMM